MRRTWLLVSPLLLLTGCAGLSAIPADPTKMTADQIDAMVKDKSATIGCIKGVYAGALVNGIALNLDKSVISTKNGGSISIDADCKVTINLAPSPG